MTAAGVPLGTPTPAQVLASYPGNASVRIPTKSPGYNGIMPPGIPE